MITKLVLHNIATYTQRVEIEPTAINYFYGGNGSGKTSLSKIIAKESDFSDCYLHWQANPIETLVYNKDFVKAHFSQSSSIKGIFTLGKDATVAKQFIETTQQEIDSHATALTGLNLSLKQKNTDETNLNNGVIGKCWTIKDKYKDTFHEAFAGLNKDKKKIFARCQQEQSNLSTLLSWDEINEKCKQVFSDTLKAYDQIPEVTFPDLSDIETSPILAIKIVGKEDVPMGALISKLNNSDWIKQGLDHLEQAENQCPFCQQAVNDNLRLEIEAVFDETYEQKIKELEDYKQTYTQTISTVITDLKEITGKELKYSIFLI